MKKSFLSALVFFGTLAVLTIGFAAWNTPPMSTVWSGSGLTANGWNALVNNIDNLNARLEIAEATIINLSVSWAVMTFNRTTCPTGWSEADGTGGRPDLRGEFIRGWNRNATGTDGGRVLGSSQMDSFKSHNHRIGNWSFPLGTLGANERTYGYSEVLLDRSAYGSTTGDMGGSETRPRNVALLYCIKD